MSRLSQASDVVRSFDDAAAGWDTLHGPGSLRRDEFAARTRYLRALCRALGRPKVLELGCGTGQNLIVIAHLVAFGVGVDLSPCMIAKARENATACETLSFMLADAEDFCRTASDQFDLVVLSGVLEHLADPAAALSGCRRVLSPNGRLVVIMPHPWHPLVRLMILLGGLGAAPARHLSPRRLRALAAPCGLQPVALHGLPFWPWRGLRLRRLAGQSDSPGGQAERWPAVLQGAYAAEFKRMHAVAKQRKMDEA